MAATVAAQEPLDRLQAELNNILFQVGKIFRNANQGDSKAVHQAKTKAKGAIPQAQSKFDDALDDLEKELTDARTVLNRDLAILKQKRAEREKAAGAARLQNGQAKAIKAEPGVKTAQNGNQKINQPLNGTQSTSSVQTSQQDHPAPDAMGLGGASGLGADLDSIFTDDLGSLAGVNGVLGGSNGQLSTANGDTAMSTDALFSDGGINLDNAEFAGLGGSGDQDEIQTILPGLEKYMNQPQDGSGGANGQASTGLADDFDLEALLNDMTGGGDTAQGQSAPTAESKDKTKTNVTNASKADVASTNAAAAPINSTDDAALKNDIGLGDAGGMDFANESTFDIDFDELTAGTGDGSTIPNDEDLNNWFNFN